MLLLFIISTNFAWIHTDPVLEDEKNVYYSGLVKRIESGDLQLIDVRGKEEAQRAGLIPKSFNVPGKLKVPGLIASDFFQTLQDFGIRRKFIFFSLPLVKFTAEKCTIWEILMKM